MQLRKLFALIVVLTAAAATALAAPRFAPPATSGTARFEAKPGRFYKLGCLPSPAASVAQHRASRKPSLRAKAPAAVDLSSLFPPVADMGTQDSGVAWATTYYYKSFQEGKERGWSLSTPDHQYSPAWTYNQTNWGRDQGSNLSTALWLLCRRGATTLAQQPYNANDYTTFPTLNQCLQAMPARAQTYSNLFQGWGGGADAIAQMKDLLASGEALVMDIAIFSDFACESPSYLYNNVGNGATYVGNEAFVVTGYDDTVGGVGGFKIRSPWGTDWGNQGSGYISYDFVSYMAYEAWTMTDRTGYVPQVWAKIQIQHQRRGDLGVELGHADVGQPITYSDTIISGQGAYARDLNLYVDVTDYGTVLGRWGLRISDMYTGNTGSLSAFTLNTGSAEMASTETPVAIPDASSVVSYLTWALDSVILSVTTAPGSQPLTADNYATISYTNLGAPAQLRLWNGQQQTIEADHGSVTVAGASSASDATHRWAAGSGGPVGSVGKSITTNLTFFEQYRKAFATDTQTTPLLSLENYAEVAYKSFAADTKAQAWDGVEAGDAVWADCGSTYTYARTSKGSDDQERWVAKNGLTGTVQNADPVVVEYWHQYKPLLTLQGTDRGHVVRLTERSLFGQSLLTTGIVNRWSEWADAGTKLSITPFTNGSPRRYTADPASWTVESELNAVLSYKVSLVISGVVRDRDKNPVADVIVNCAGQEVKTDAKGFYAIRGLDPGSYTVTPSKLGCYFSPQRRDVELAEETGDSSGNYFDALQVPSITGWWPLGSAVAPTTDVRVFFSEAMNRVATQGAFSLREMYPNSTTLGPPLAGTITWEQAGRALVFVPSVRLKAYHGYKLTVSTQARSALGAALPQAFEWTFQTNDCLSLVRYAPKGLRAACNAPLVMEFDRDVDQATVRSAFAVNPSVAGVLEFPTPRTARFIPSQPLALNTRYTVVIAATAAGLDKVTLKDPFTWTFTTQTPTAVVSVTPTGTSAAASSPVVVTFDRPMDRGLTRAAFALTSVANGSPVPGSFSWDEQGVTMTFRPAAWLAGNTQYRVRIAKTATSLAGAPLAAAYESLFTTANVLRVAEVSPLGDAALVNVPIRVKFDRPVKPGTLQLSTVPQVDGTVTWPDTSTALFTPHSPFAIQTRYVVTVSDALEAVDGTQMPAPYSWSFTTHGLTQVLGRSPQGANVKPGATIGLTFDRAMDTVSVAQNLQVWMEMPTRQEITGSIRWLEGNRSLIFTPTVRLPSHSDFRVTLANTALSADGLQLAAGAEWMFQTASCVQIRSYGPTGLAAVPSSDIMVQFDRRMARASVQRAFTITPAVAGDFVWDSSFLMKFHPRQPLTAGQTYTVKLFAAARAADGLTLLSPFEFSFRVSPAGVVSVAATAAQSAGGSVAISFTLGTAAQVQVQVINLAGRPVANLSPAGLNSAGANVLLWNGLSNLGSRVPPGTYLVQVTAHDAAGGQASALTPLQLR